MIDAALSERFDECFRLRRAPEPVVGYENPQLQIRMRIPRIGEQNIRAKCGSQKVIGLEEPQCGKVPG